MSELRQGRKLKSIFWSDDTAITEGENGCVSLEVVMEDGQMSGVPWVKATLETGVIFHYNGAVLAGVRIHDES